MSPAVNKHALIGWCQQKGSICEIIFSLNERLNELLSHVEPVFNNKKKRIWVALSVLVTHCLEIGSVCFARFFWQRQSEGEWQSQACVRLLSTAAPLRPTDNTLLARRVASVPPSSRGVLLTAESEDGGFCFHRQECTHRCYWIGSLLPRFPREEPKNRKWKEMQHIERVSVLVRVL